MKLKYKSISKVPNTEKEQTFETPYLSYNETTKDEFIVLDFVDHLKIQHHLEISKDEIRIKYNDQVMLFKINQRVPITYVGPNDTKFVLETYLRNILINNNNIEFSYNIMQKDIVITDNKVTIITL